MKQIITRQPRSCRYMIFVNDQHEASSSRKPDAFKEAKRIRTSWKNAQTVQVVDTWAFRDGETKFDF